jgi:hypothetical protein
VTINASCTNLVPEGTRRHIRAALHEGATRDEILMVLKMASILSIHSCALGGPIVLEEASEASLDAAGVGRAKRLKKAGERTPAIDKMKALKQWNDSWDPLVALGSGLGRSIHGGRRSHLHHRRVLDERDRTHQHRARCILHAHVCVRNATSHQSSTRSRGGGRRNHGSPEALRSPGRPVLQSRRPHSCRRAYATFEPQRISGPLGGTMLGFERDLWDYATFLT